MSWLAWFKGGVDTKPADPDVETFRWGIDVQRDADKTYYLVTRSTKRDDGSWSYDRTIGLFPSREEAQAFVQAHVDLPAYFYTEHRKGGA